LIQCWRGSLARKSPTTLPVIGHPSTYFLNPTR